MGYYDEDEDEAYGFDCELCGKVLTTENGWRCHMRSKVHDDRTVHCPRCARSFRTPADMVMHIEQGNCVAITRRGIRDTVRSWEMASGNHNLFTTKCIEWKEEPEVSSTRNATEDSFNGYFFECPLCPKEYKKLAHLNQHLNSAAHDANDYHCKNCGIKFKLLSALIHHFQSGKCGAMSYKAVEEITNEAARHINRCYR